MESGVVGCGRHLLDGPTPDLDEAVWVTGDGGEEERDCLCLVHYDLGGGDGDLQATWRRCDVLPPDGV